MRPERRRTIVAFLLYGALAVASFVPVSLRPRDTIAYVGDSLESVYIVAWNVRQAFRAPARLFEANVLHPNARALAYTDHRLLPSLAVAPVVWLTRNPVLAANVAMALACLLAAAGARRLALALGLAPLGAWGAGALYGFHTYQVNEGPRLNIVAHGFLAFALLDFVRYLKGGERRHALAAAGWMLLQGLSANYHLLYGALLLGLVLLMALVARPRETARRLPVLVASAAVAAALFAPVALPYVQTAGREGYVRDLPAGIDLVHYVSTAPTNLLYGAIGTEVRLQQRGPHFVGFVSLALALLALVAVARRGRAVSGGPDEEGGLLPARVWVPAAAGLALVFVALSLGRDVEVGGHRLGPGPYRLLHAAVPGFQLVRIPERLGLLAMLFVALLAGHGLTLVAARSGVVALVLAALVPLEHLGPLPASTRVPVTRDVPSVYRWLASRPAGAVAEVPIHGEGLVREETLEMYFSTFHGFKPIVHGYTAYPPLLTRVLRRMAAEFPSEASLQALQRVGVDVVIVHHGRPVGGDLARRLRDTGRYDAGRFRDLLRRADLDLFDRLPGALAAGRIRRELRLEGADARLYESTADEVYRLVPRPPHEAAPFPVGLRIAEPGWQYRAKLGDPTLAADGRMDTAWVAPRFLLGDEFYEVVFGRPVVVSGLVLRLRRDSAWPTRFRVAGRDGRGAWTEIARFDEAHALQLLDRLRDDPRSAALGFDLGDQTLTGVSLLVDEAGTSFEGWSVPEVEVWSSEPGAAGP
jgi:hypothetical protein